MQLKLSMQQWLTVISRSMPPRGVLYVGAGSGTRAIALCNQVETAAAVFVEADEHLAARLSAAVQGRPNWSAHTVLLADTDEEEVFHVASSQNESGLIEPERLSCLWRNLQERESRRIRASTVDRFLETSAQAAGIFTWAVIDCFPAARILSGAANSLPNWDVVVARVIADASLSSASGASKDEVDALLAPTGYRLLTLEQERHPAVALALYVRDWKVVLESQLVQQRSQLAQLIRSREEHATLLSGQKARIETLSQTNEELRREHSAHAARREELESEVQALGQARAEQAKLATELQAQIEALTQTSEQRQQEQSALTARHDQLEGEVHALAQARDEQTKLATERQAQIAALTQTCDKL
ncbi:hypothetical protein, partial [Accumulibacter sp.]|uniref:hypothetical protein n=1 Tax=Accumulibacter sp. TaxID=2053492 RepID=UPI00257EABE1